MTDNKTASVLAAVAAQHGVSMTEVEKSIQDAIDAAWDAPEGAQARQKLFPDGKPSIAQFLATMATLLPSEAGGGLGAGQSAPMPWVH